MKLYYTDYPFKELGDKEFTAAPIRPVVATNYDNNKYCDIIVDGISSSIKVGYVWLNKHLTRRAQSQSLEKPQYKHNCTSCLFLGQYSDVKGECDIYWCKNHDSHNISAIIARFSNNVIDYVGDYPPDEYISPEIHLGVWNIYFPWYGAALKIAKEVGLYKGKY